MFDDLLEHRAGPTKTVAGIEQAIDLRSVPRPLLDLVEIPHVGDQWIGGLVVEVNVVWLRSGMARASPAAYPNRCSEHGVTNEP
jgi:hypothetical protein